MLGIGQHQVGLEAFVEVIGWPPGIQLFLDAGDQARGENGDQQLAVQALRFAFEHVALVQAQAFGPAGWVVGQVAHGVEQRQHVDHVALRRAQALHTFAQRL
ncbi:hypothetical protein D3C79_546930 [compost metagenome]